MSHDPPSLTIQLDGVSRRYGWQWIFRDFSANFSSGTTYAICGHNGSGKSTLLRLLSSMESPNEGKRMYLIDGKEVADIAPHLSFSAPYMEVPDHLTVREILSFHSRFKRITMSPEDIIADMELEHSANKYIHNLSSGQRQKIKLALAICNSDPLLLLDEPGTNLDVSNYAWFAEKIRACQAKKLICIATNESRDLALCQETITMGQSV